MKLKITRAMSQELSSSSFAYIYNFVYERLAGTSLSTGRAWINICFWLSDGQPHSIKLFRKDPPRCCTIAAKQLFRLLWKKTNGKAKCEKLCMNWLLLSLLQKPSPEGMVDHSGHVLDCKQTVEFLCGEHQNRMNGYHTAIQLLLRALVRLCWLTQIQLRTSWLPGRFTMKSSYVRWRVSGRKPRLMNGRQMLTSTICACFMMGSRGVMDQNRTWQCWS